MTLIVLLALMVLTPKVWASRVLMSQICNAESRVMYCTCEPSDYDTESVDCVLLAEVSSAQDPVWKAFGEELRDIRLNSRPEGLLTYLPQQLFKQRRLRSAYVRHAHLHLLPSYSFNRSSVVSLDLASNAIRTLEPHALSHLGHLEELFLSDNELQVIHRLSLHHLPALKLLSLDRNRISTMDPGALDSLHRLAELELSSNRIKDLKPSFFKGLSALTRLDLGKNLLEHLPARAFHLAPELREIVLRENRLRSIDKDAFEGLKGLYTLYLSRNLIGRLHPHSFRPTPALLYLDLRSNRLTTLSQPTVQPLNLTNNLTRIYLEDNRFVCDCSIRWMLDMFNLRHADHVSEWKEVRCFPPVEGPSEGALEVNDQPQVTAPQEDILDGYFEGSSSSRPFDSAPAGLPLDQARGLLAQDHCPLAAEELTLPSTQANDLNEEEEDMGLQNDMAPLASSSTYFRLALALLPLPLLCLV